MNDLLFGNNNQAVIRKLADRSIKSDKRSRAFLLLTIALAVCMVFSIFLVSTGTQEEYKNTQRGKAQIGILGITDEQLALLRQNENVSWVGEYSALGLFYEEGKTITVAYGNEEYFLQQEKITFQGDIPQSKNEIMLSQNYLDFLGEAYTPGDTILLDLTGTGDEAYYTLSAILDEDKESNGYFVYVSKELAYDLAGDTFQVTGYTRLNTDAIDSASILDVSNRAIKDTGIEEGQVNLDKLRGIAPGWIRNQLEKAGEVLTIFTGSSKRYILHLEQDKGKLPQLCATSRKIPDILSGMLWSQGFPAILTSGTLKAGNGFSRTRQENGLGKEIRVMEYVAESPFAYEKNCLLYLPQTLRRTKHGSREEAVMMAQHIQRLICSTYGHTLVLFTSYSLMGSVYQILRDSLPFPMVEVWRNAQEEIMRFKTMENAVLFAAGSCWEGVDFPGDIVSSLIIVKLPFAVPDPLREAEKERYATLTEYIRDIIVPDMQKKLRQGFGRAIRTESDTCVVSILDHRAVAGGRYHEDVLCALPACQMAETIEDVETFIRRQKCEEYYM